MKANEFVKKFGLDLAKREYIVKHYGLDILDDIKRLVESHELVMEHGSLERAKMYANSPYTAPEVKERLKQAIADVESCQ